MDPREPLPFRSAHALIDELPAAAIEDMARIAGPGSPLALVQLRHMGGALAPPRAGRGSARDAPRRDLRVRPRGRPGRGRGAGGPVRARRRCSAAVAPQRVGDYPNFVEAPADASGFFDPDTWERLRRVKALYDPQDLFKGNHHVPPRPRSSRS